MGSGELKRVMIVGRCCYGGKEGAIEKKGERKRKLNRTLLSQRKSEVKIGLGPCESDGQFSPLRFPS